MQRTVHNNGQLYKCQLLIYLRRTTFLSILSFLSSYQRPSQVASIILTSVIRRVEVLAPKPAATMELGNCTDLTSNDVSAVAPPDQTFSSSILRVVAGFKSTSVSVLSYLL
jgi:hypothetical protein